nr:MAG TPA: hypothetical protein [Caudoviricetes sp.]
MACPSLTAAIGKDAMYCALSPCAVPMGGR